MLGCNDEYVARKIEGQAYKIVLTIKISPWLLQHLLNFPSHSSRSSGGGGVVVGPGDIGVFFSLNDSMILSGTLSTQLTLA